MLKTLTSKIPKCQKSKKEEFKDGIQSDVGVKCNAAETNRSNKVVEFECDQCTAIFNTLTKYTTHKRRVHIRPNKCLICTFRAGSKYEITQHNLHEQM